MKRQNLSTKEKYDRNARRYDIMELFPESLFFGKFRKALFSKVDPIRGLLQVKRVLKPTGRFYALEHVRPKGWLLGSLFDTIAPFVENRTGVNINKNTVENIKNARFEIELENNLILDIFKMIVTRPIKS